MLEKLSQMWLEVRVRHFCDIWHPADHALTQPTIVLTDTQQKHQKPDKFPTEPKESTCHLFSSEKNFSSFVLF